MSIEISEAPIYFAQPSLGRSEGTAPQTLAAGRRSSQSHVELLPATALFVTYLPLHLARYLVETR